MQKRFIENVGPVSEIYKTVRGQIDTVSGDMGQRIKWLAIGQPFFFSAYAILFIDLHDLSETLLSGGTRRR